MSYWKCTEAKILDDGRTVEMRFEDDHSPETMSITLPVEHWKNIFVYRFAYEEPERRLIDAHKTLCNYLFDTARIIREKGGE